MHWVLDVCTNEDSQRNRSDNGPENLALDIARVEPSKDAISGKIKKAGWSDDFMLNMVRSAANVD